MPQREAWELVHPRGAQQRSEDLEEVERMIEAGEDEIATEELRWLIEGCRDFLDAHRLLGELALGAGDVKLARAHFGYAYDLGTAALPPQGLRGTLPYDRPSNRGLLEAAKGLAYCLHRLARVDAARQVIERLLALDPADPLGVRGWLSEWPSG